jgi:hypothetical protein
VSDHTRSRQLRSRPISFATLALMNRMNAASCPASVGESRTPHAYTKGREDLSARPLSETQSLLLELDSELIGAEANAVAGRPELEATEDVG